MNLVVTMHNNTNHIFMEVSCMKDNNAAYLIVRSPLVVVMSALQDPSP